MDILRSCRRRYSNFGVVHRKQYINRWDSQKEMARSLDGGLANEASPQDVPKADSQTILHHFSRVLTRGGSRRDRVLARVNMHLRHRYLHPNPISAAVDAIKPVIKYQKLPHARMAVPQVLPVHAAIGTAIRWIVEAAGSRTYVGGRPSLERGLVDEIDAVLAGTSSLYAKRFQFHKNPN